MRDRGFDANKASIAQAWSGYALHVRTNGWSLVWAGVALSAGSMTRLLVQQDARLQEIRGRGGMWALVKGLSFAAQDEKEEEEDEREKKHEKNVY